MKTFILIVSLLALINACDNIKTRPAENRYGFVSGVIRTGGLERNFLYRLPLSLDHTSRPPLVIILHAFTRDAASTLEMGLRSLKSKMDRDSAIVVMPNAMSRHWNDMMGGSYPATDSVDDVAFLSRLIDHFINKYHCNPGRVYVAGLSNGGTMACRLACDIPEKITALCMFISTIGREASKKYTRLKPLPVIIMNGTADTTFKWQGGSVGLPSRPIIRASSVEENLGYWKRRNGITGGPDSILLPDACPGDSSRVMAYYFKGKADMVFYKIINGGHSIPYASPVADGRHQNCDFDALGVAWDFLLSKTKQLSISPFVRQGWKQ